MMTTFYPPYNFGGDGIFVHRLSNELARRGHTVDVIHCRDSFNLISASKTEETYSDHPNVTVHGLKSGMGALSPVLTQMTGAPLLKRHRIEHILKKGFDVIHYHNMSLLGLNTINIGKAIKLYTMHEHWLVCPMHVLWKFGERQCEKKECIQCTVRAGIPPQLWRYTNHIKKNLKALDRLISPSEFTKEKHERDGIGIRIDVLPHFLPRKSVTDKKEELKNVNRDTPYFLFVGRLEKIKGVQDLISVFKQSQEYNLYIAGAGNYETELRDMASGFSNIKFLGHVEQASLSYWYEKATALIVPSLCFEVFGMVVLEAYAVKTPVIVKDCGALPEVVNRGGGGIVYSSEKELSTAVRQLANSDDLRKKMGDAGHDSYLKLWTEDRHVDSYLKLIANIYADKMP